MKIKCDTNIWEMIREFLYISVKWFMILINIYLIMIFYRKNIFHIYSFRNYQLFEFPLGIFR